MYRTKYAPVDQEKLSELLATLYHDDGGMLVCVVGDKFRINESNRRLYTMSTIIRKAIEDGRKYISVYKAGELVETINL